MPSTTKKAVSTMVSDNTPSIGLHNSSPPTATDSSAVTKVHRNPGTLRAENRGGIGKTAVALAIVSKLARTFRDGMQLVDLASLASPDLVAAHLASVLRLPAPDTQLLQYVIGHLRTRRMLIVFDNCEDVVKPVSEIAEAILQGAPEVHILATSREP